MTNAVELYEELKALSSDRDAPFFHKDQERHGERYRIFSYHFADPETWLRPSALEARGIMFRMKEDNPELVDALVSRPMKKFFNKGEVDFINYGHPLFVMDKVDGSLISSYMTGGGELHLKSKTSLKSDHALYAEELLERDLELKRSIERLEHEHLTVNMELVSPDPTFRIVVHYDHPRLIVLNARSRITGKYLSHDQLRERVPASCIVKHKPLWKLNTLHNETDMEGYVVVDEYGNWWKEKCTWYLHRHRVKTFVVSPKAFAELVIKDKADDAIELLADQPGLLKQMRELQHQVASFANKVVREVTEFYQENQGLSRRDFATKAKDIFPDCRLRLGLAMVYHGGKEPDWKAALLKQVKRMEFTENGFIMGS